MEPTSLRRTAVVLALPALFALSACGPVDKAGAGPSDASSTPAATSSSDTGGDSGDATRTPSASPHDTGDDSGTDGNDSKPAPTRASGDMCTSGDLHVSTENAGAAAGHAVTRLVFQNTSGDACWVRGFPGVSYVAGGDGHQVGGPAVRDHSRGPSSARIWLIPNGHAYALLNQANPHNFPSSDCDPTDVRGLRVYPPEETESVYVPDATQACADGDTGRPQISALSKAEE